MCRGALAADNAEADIDGERQLGWYNSGHRIALDVARGLSFLHGINVRAASSSGRVLHLWQHSQVASLDVLTQKLLLRSRALLCSQESQAHKTCYTSHVVVITI